MSRLSCITELRTCHAMSALDEAIESIRDDIACYGAVLQTLPEERAKTLRILGNLLELQADELLLSVREGEAMNIRQTLEAANDPDDTPTPPAAGAAVPQMERAA